MTLFEILQSEFGNPQISPFDFLSCTACSSKKQGAGIAGMLTSNAKRIFCDNVTCFGTNKCCSNRSHLPECSIKAPHLLLAWLLCLFTSQPATHPITLAVAIHTLRWKMRVEKCPFSLFSMASSLVLFVFGHGVETSHLGNVSAQELCQASGDFSLEQVGIDVSARCTHESSSLDDNMTKYARSQRKVQENKVTLCDVASS